MPRIELSALRHVRAKVIAFRLLPWCFRGPDSKKGAHRALSQVFDFLGPFGAGEAIRTPDPNLGKVMLYP